MKISDTVRASTKLCEVFCRFTFLEGQTFKIYISQMVKARAKNMCETCRFWHLQLNGVIVKIVLCDHELVFEVQQV